MIQTFNILSHWLTSPFSCSWSSRGQTCTGPRASARSWPAPRPTPADKLSDIYYASSRKTVFMSLRSGRCLPEEICHWRKMAQFSEFKFKLNKIENLLGPLVKSLQCPSAADFPSCSATVLLVLMCYYGSVLLCYCTAVLQCCFANCAVMILCCSPFVLQCYCTAV